MRGFGNIFELVLPRNWHRVQKQAFEFSVAEHGFGRVARSAGEFRYEGIVIGGEQHAERNWLKVLWFLD